MDVGFPAEDLAGYVDGAPLTIGLLPSMRRTGHSFGLRHYQQDAVEVFHAGGDASGGSGVIVLPCGAGKTMVGMGVMDRLQTNTLILTTNTVAVRQWIDELIDKTNLNADVVGEYTGDSKQIRPVTIATYQILTYHRKGRKAEGELDEWSAKGSADLEEWPHFKIFNERDWGLVIYDEVHLLPAPDLPHDCRAAARRRLGLTATLVREDGREEEVFALIGPKRYDVPWKDLERQGWIATAHCHEIRLDIDPEERIAYTLAESREQYTTRPATVQAVAVEEILPSSRTTRSSHRPPPNSLQKPGAYDCTRRAAHRQDAGGAHAKALPGDARRQFARAGRLKSR